MSTRVWIGPNEARDVEVISSTQLVATYMGGGGESEDVIVETRHGSVVARGAFSHENPPPLPTIEKVEPNSGRGGTRVTIVGTGFEA